MSRIVNLKNYEVVFTTSFEFPHGISGHTYEMIDYFWISHINGIKCAILLSDGTTKEFLERAIRQKYDFTEDEVAVILSNTVESERPGILMTNQLCIVDGSWRVGNCMIYADHVYLLRCSEEGFEKFHNHKTIKHTHLMQDFKLYEERFEELNIEVVDYVKKILWSRYRIPNEDKTKTAMFYLTTNCRYVAPADIQKLIVKHSFEKYLIITNNVAEYAGLASETVMIEEAPVTDILNRFDTYIYTTVPDEGDCSPRFIVECAAFGKDVIYEIDYICPGIERRKQDIERGITCLMLAEDDDFVKYVKCNL